MKSYSILARLLATLCLAGWLAVPARGLATNIVVTNLAGSGAGTLRSALTNAQNGDLITFAVTGLVTNVVAGGLTISNNVSIVGPGPGLLALTGTNGGRAFSIKNGVTVSLSGLTFTNCAGWDPVQGYYGGAIYNGGNLSLSNCLFTGCHGHYGGSSPLNNGSAGGTGGSGGAIYNGGALTAVDCQFLNNAAGGGGPGAAGNASQLTLWTAGGNGGGGGSGGAICDAGTASFLNCTFGWNGSGSGGAGGVGANGYFSSGGHTAGPGSVGGNGGDAGNGSAVFSLGGATFADCTFFGNTNGAGGAAGNGGAGYLSNFPGAQGGNGGQAGSGSLYCTGAVQLLACTFAANMAGRGGNGGSGGAGANDTSNGPGGNGGHGGNGANGGNGGGIAGPSTNSAFTLQNVLIAQNLAAGAGSAGGGGGGGSGLSSGSNGSAGTNGLAGTGPDLSGSFLSQGHNLVGLRTGNSGFTNNVLGDLAGTGTTLNARLGTLTNNSGSVWTCALQNGSPALDAGDDTITGSPLNLTNDARGFSRLSGSHVDIGAYEHQWATTPVAFHPAFTGGGVQLAVTNVPGAHFTVLAASSPATPPASWTVLGVMSETSPGQFQWLDTSYTNHSLLFYRLRNP